MIPFDRRSRFASSILSFGISYYSGRRDFNIGLVGEALLVDGLTVLEGDMVLQYFF